MQHKIPAVCQIDTRGAGVLHPCERPLKRTKIVPYVNIVMTRTPMCGNEQVTADGLQHE